MAHNRPGPCLGFLCLKPIQAACRPRQFQSGQEHEAFAIPGGTKTLHQKENDPSDGEAIHATPEESCRIQVLIYILPSGDSSYNRKPVSLHNNYCHMDRCLSAGPGGKQ